MSNVKQQLYEMLLYEFERRPSYALSRALFLFCEDNKSFDLPESVKTVFVEGIRKEEVRAFGLRYGRDDKTSDGAKQPEASKPDDLLRKAAFEKLVLKLSVATEKTYSGKMVEQINSRVKSGLSYDEILEMFIVADSQID